VFWVCQEQRVRHHERRLSAAICSLRKLRKEQRVLQEVDGISLDEVAKVHLPFHNNLIIRFFSDISSYSKNLLNKVEKFYQNLFILF
jgi:hypothetical protein